MFRTLDTFDTGYFADSVEWCPIYPFRNIFVCGTYQLKESDGVRPPERLGCIYLFEVVKGGRLKLLQRLEVAAVLDMKWAHGTVCAQIFLAVANCLGYLVIYEFIAGDREKRLYHRTERKIRGEGEGLALSLDWSSGRWSEFDNYACAKIVVSDSNGCISLFVLDDIVLSRISSWVGHEDNAWIAAFDYWNTNVIYSGGDDNKLQCFDIRMWRTPAIATIKVHTMGVTSIHSNAKKRFLLSSGSYDEKLRLWDTRYMDKPVSEKDLGGGIWRLKWDPFTGRYLLAACMHGGFKIVDCLEVENPSIVFQYHEHESIAYGSDWSYLNGIETADLIRKQGWWNIFRRRDPEWRNAFLMATCSFYDHTLKLSMSDFGDNGEFQ